MTETIKVSELKKAIKEKTKVKVEGEKGGGVLYLYRRGKENKLSWVVRYQNKGKDKYYSLGSADFENRKGLGLKKAKDKYYELKLLIRDGEDLREYFERQQAEKAKQERLKNKKNISFKDFVSETYLPTAKIKKAEKTYLTQKRHFEIWLYPVIGKRSFDEITINDCFKIRDEMNKAGRSPRTIQHVFQSFHHAWQFALDDELTEKRCPTESRKFELEPVRNEKTRVLNHTEEKHLLDYLSLFNPQLKDMVIVSLETGLRAGELFKLEWQDISIKERKITVQAHKCKTGKARSIPMSDRCYKSIKSQSHNKNSFVFLNKNGEQFKAVPSPYWKALNYLKLNDSREARERLTWHSLRHTFATRLQETTGDIATVQKMLGHSQITTTTRYSHVNEKMLSDAIFKLEDFNKVNQQADNIIQFTKSK
ncbi:MAG: tyrosine-type recombinase/integrase [Thermotogota bacterium]